MAQYMLTENQVVEAVASYLKSHGWQIRRTSTGRQRGFDVLAKRHGRSLAVEAKGGGSGTKGTRRYGKPFTSNQKRSHVGMALLSAAQIVSKGEHNAAIAVPDDPEHRKLVTRIGPVLKRLGITVYLVAPDMSVVTIGTC